MPAPVPVADGIGWRGEGGGSSPPRSPAPFGSAVILGAAGNPASFAWGTGADERSRQYAKWVAESPRPMVNLVLRYGQSRRSERNSDGARSAPTSRLLQFPRRRV